MFKSVIKNSAKPPAPGETTTRLLEAAGQVFAERGFRAATIREICERAQTNIASINYHFGTKEKLYEEALKNAHRLMTENFPLKLDLDTNTPADEKIRIVVATLLQRIMSPKVQGWQRRLILRELLAPSAALDTLVQDRIMPLFDQLVCLAAELLGLTPTQQQAQLAAASIAGQCMLYFHGRPVAQRLLPYSFSDENFVKTLAEHIAEFSLYALRGMRQNEKGW